MQFFVRFGGECWTINDSAMKEVTVQALQLEIHRLTALPITLQRLTYGTKHLESTKSLQNYCITEGATVNVLLRAYGGDGGGGGSSAQGHSNLGNDSDDTEGHSGQQITHNDADSSSEHQLSAQNPAISTCQITPVAVSGHQVHVALRSSRFTEVDHHHHHHYKSNSSRRQADPVNPPKQTNNPTTGKGMSSSLRVKKLSGEEFLLVLETLDETVGSLKCRICELHSLEQNEIKLVYKTQALTSDTLTLKEVGLKEDELIHIVLVGSSHSPKLAPTVVVGATTELDQPAKAPKKPFHCAWDSCLERYAKVIGDCVYCKGKYCARHRLPESHHCQNIQSCKQLSFDTNHSKVMNGKCVGEYAL